MHWGDPYDDVPLAPLPIANFDWAYDASQYLEWEEDTEYYLNYYGYDE